MHGPNRFQVALAGLLWLAPSSLLAQARPEPPSDRKTSLSSLSQTLKWEQPTTPMKVVGPIYYVGTEGLASWLITTPQGHILMNTGLASSGPMIADSVRQLGFRPEDIRFIVFCHAHVDHVGALAQLKKLSRARVVAMQEEVELLQSGGGADFLFANEQPFRFEPVKAEVIARDGDRLPLGDVVLTARLTPGHTRGTTTWTTRVMDGGKGYNVVFADGTGVNSEARLAGKPSYPDIESDYWRTFSVLESLKPDIWFSPHTQNFDFQAKRIRAAQEGPAAWVDPEGYKRFLAEQKQKFEAQLKADRAAPATRP
jgi:metallo-beta-lactamase class B